MLVIKALLCLAAAATAASGMPAHQSRSATLRHRSLAHQPGSYAPLLPRSATPELKENTGDSKDGPQAVPSTNTCDASDVLTGPEMYNIHSGPRAGEAQPKATEVEAKGDLCTLPSAPADISKPAASEGKRYIAYSSVYHGVGLGQLPDPSQLEGMTHLILCKLFAVITLTRQPLSTLRITLDRTKSLAWLIGMRILLKRSGPDTLTSRSWQREYPIRLC